MIRALLDRAISALGGYTRADIIDTQVAEVRAQRVARHQAAVAVAAAQQRAADADRRYALVEGFLKSANRRLEDAGMISVTTFL